MPYILSLLVHEPKEPRVHRRAYILELNVAPALRFERRPILSLSNQVAERKASHVAHEAKGEVLHQPKRSVGEQEVGDGEAASFVEHSARAAKPGVSVEAGENRDQLSVIEKRAAKFTDKRSRWLAQHRMSMQGTASSRPRRLQERTRHSAGNDEQRGLGLGVSEHLTGASSRLTCIVVMCANGGDGGVGGEGDMLLEQQSCTLAVA